MKKRIAIIYTFDDNIVNYAGGSKTGIKSKLSYFDQFLISYESIKENWSSKEFTYEFYIVHTKDFLSSNKNILDNLDVTLIKTKSPFGGTGKRTTAFTVDIDCDFRLILDNDTIGLKTPTFDFTKDILVSYGGSTYSKNIYEKICKEILNITPPNEHPIHSNSKPVSFSDYEYVKYYESKGNKRLFPALNAGAIMIKNELSQIFGKKLIESVKKLPEISKKFGGRSLLVVQPIYGIVVNDITNNWYHFDKGFNFLLTSFGRIPIVNSKYKGNVYLAHYINHDKKDFFTEKIEYYMNKIEKYKK